MTDNAERVRRARSGSRMMHGGFTAAIPLTAEERQQADAIVDTLIPPEEDWPDAASLGIADLLEVYIVPDDEPVSFYPHWRRAEFSELLAAVGGPLIGLSLDDRIEQLKGIEADDAAFFARVRDFVYYVYYGHSAVVKKIRETTKHGADYLGGGQPEGYSDSIETWGDRTFTTRGAFIPTDAVFRALTKKEQA